jgi:hypothetical protein
VVRPRVGARSRAAPVIHLSYIVPLHSVRFDDETEAALMRVRNATGASASEVMKEGVVALSDRLARQATVRPFDIYRKLDVGPGGYARAPARNAKRGLKAILRRKHKG